MESHSDLRERAALKRAGYLDALRSALQERDVPDTTTAVAAELAVMAFYTALNDWATDESATDLGELADQRLLQATAAAAALGGSSDRKVSAATRAPASRMAAATAKTTA